MEEQEITSKAAASNNLANGRDMDQMVERLKEENQKIQSEFNMQRAKLQKLFMQKESELGKILAERNSLQGEINELKSQFVVADLRIENALQLQEKKSQEEILSLQQMVQDTIEESTSLKEDIKRLWLENKELREHLQQQQLQHHHQQQQESAGGLAPQVLSQVKKTLVRKLGGDTGVVQQQDSINTSIDLESVKSPHSSKNNAEEDAEMMRSIVEQLQEEMKALKEKLREADEKLQSNDGVELRKLQALAGLNKATSIESSENDLAVSQKYEEKIKELMENGIQDKEHIASLQESIEKEAALRKDLEDQWQDKREAHKVEVQLLREQVKTNEQQLLELQEKFLDTRETITLQLQKLTQEREKVNKQLETLQADNDFLSGRYLATAEEIENQDINLPSSVDELHEIILRQQNELIQARMGSEFEKQKLLSSKDEIQLLRDQLDALNEERRSYKRKEQSETKSLQERLKEHLLTVQNLESRKASLERKEVELNRQISQFRVDNIELQEQNEKLNKINMESRSKIKNLQEDLANMEHVQKDFVQLSQRLQMSIEQLRQADKEVRWQDDDDVDNCPTCSAYFTVMVRKMHCRHCGQIYCDKCLAKSVPSGPRKRPARVCDLCHTLLNPDTAPYFSHAPPHETGAGKI